jgi:hypothetical protein
MPNEIEMNEIASSSNVKAIGFDPSTKTVRTEFLSKPGTFYEYWPVEESDYDAIRNAPSIGAAVRQYLVKGAYSSRKV